VQVIGTEVREDQDRRFESTGISKRSFGYTFAAILAGIGLRPLNHAWTRLGALLKRIVSPIVSAVVFFVTVTPIGAILRFSGKDPLGLRADDKAESYWLVREPPGPIRRRWQTSFGVLRWRSYERSGGT
jgi:hypothetical protein